MTLRLYDTASRAVRAFVPIKAGHVGIYQCGLTVQSAPHIGHLRSGVNYDVLSRWLRHTGHEVRLIRNITDIDDRVLVKAVEQGTPWWALAYANERALSWAYAELGVLPPTYEPRATGQVPEMLALIARLIERGHAYAAGGDVYFDVRSAPAYGALSGQKLDHMQSAADGDDSAKRDPRDFALWKGAKPSEPPDAAWDSPYGRGRPGWHLECSAMAWRYLGETFDIHGGGLDLIFPHHENEIAQSTAAGFGFARYWMHNALLNLGAEKMSKSVGNVIDLPALTGAGFRPSEIRYYLAAPHYRSAMEFSEDALRDAVGAYRRIEGFVHRTTERVGTVDPGVLCAEFVTAMDDDLNTARALASVHDVVRDGNAALADGIDTAAAGALASVRGMLGVLGLDPLDEHWQGPAQQTDLRLAVDALVALAVEQREQARARKDYTAADTIRDQLKHAGILIEDTPRGPRWTLAERG